MQTPERILSPLAIAKKHVLRICKRPDKYLPVELDTLIKTFMIDVNNDDIYGNTLMHLIAETNAPPDIVDVLMSHGANIYHQNIYWQSPMHVACELGSDRFARYLLERYWPSSDHVCGKINESDMWGYTPLGYCCKHANDDVELARLLIEVASADPAETQPMDDGSITCIELAQQGGNVNIHGYLKSLEMKSVNAFLMGLHDRTGGDSVVQNLYNFGHLTRFICQISLTTPAHEPELW